MAAGFGITKLGQSMDCNPAFISSLSILTVSFIRFIVWIPAFKFTLNKGLIQTCFPSGGNGLQYFALGVLIPLLSLIIVFVFGLNSGWIVLEGWMWNRAGILVLLSTILVSVLINASVALLEETIFRGYLISALRTVCSLKTVLFFSSIIFSLAHLLPYSNRYSTVDTGLLLVLFTLFGLLFGWTYIKTGSLWLPIAIHFAWDFFENDVINLSGDSSNPHLIGAVTSLKGPLNLPAIENAILLDFIALILIISGIYFWLSRQKNKNMV